MTSEATIVFLLQRSTVKATIVFIANTNSIHSKYTPNRKAIMYSVQNKHAFYPKNKHTLLHSDHTACPGFTTSMENMQSKHVPLCTEQKPCYIHNYNEGIGTFRRHLPSSSFAGPFGSYFPRWAV